MAEVTRHIVSRDEDGMRLDRWFRVHLPQVNFAYLNKLTRSGQVRVEGGRARTNTRLTEGQEIRVPPLNFEKKPADEPAAEVKPLSKADRALLKGMALYEDKDLLILNKPPGLAVQGGTGTHRHLDGLLESLGLELGERPRLVHRLDRDTSGVIVVAKRRAIAAALGKLFATRGVKKTYWAAVRGVPSPAQGKVDVALIKAKGPRGDRYAQAKRARKTTPSARSRITMSSTRRRRSSPGCRSSPSPAGSISCARIWRISARRLPATRSMTATRICRPRSAGSCISMRDASCLRIRATARPSM